VSVVSSNLNCDFFTVSPNCISFCYIVATNGDQQIITTATCHSTVIRHTYTVMPMALNVYLRRPWIPVYVRTLYNTRLWQPCYVTTVKAITWHIPVIHFNSLISLSVYCKVSHGLRACSTGTALSSRYRRLHCSDSAKNSLELIFAGIGLHPLPMFDPVDRVFLRHTGLHSKSKTSLKLGYSYYSPTVSYCLDKL